MSPQQRLRLGLVLDLTLGGSLALSDFCYFRTPRERHAASPY